MTTIFLFSQSAVALTGGEKPTGPDSMRNVIHWFASDEAGTVIKSCSGTVVQYQYIVTAAHCVTSDAKDSINIRRDMKTVEFYFPILHGGSTYEPHELSPVKVQIEYVFVHPIWEFLIDSLMKDPQYIGRRSIKTFAGNPATPDIAILKLAKPISRNSFDLTQTQPKTEDFVWIAGYGEGKELPYGSGSFLKVSQKPIKQILEESVITLDISTIDPKKFSQFTFGDSGGPVFKQVDSNLVLLGVMSSFTGNLILNEDGSIAAVSTPPPDTWAYYLNGKFESGWTQSVIKGEFTADTDYWSWIKGHIKF